MKFGYVKVATFTPQVKVGNVEENLSAILQGIKSAQDNGVELLVTPELCLTGYTCGDLFFSSTLLHGVEDAVKQIIKASAQYKALLFIGAPLIIGGRLYDCAVAISNGEVKAIIPKNQLNDQGGSSESRYFTPYAGENYIASTPFGQVVFGNKVVFANQDNPSCIVGVEFLSGATSLMPPSFMHASKGATIIAGMGAREEFYSQTESLTNMVDGFSFRTQSCYAYANAGKGESTTDCVYSGHSVISEYGVTLAQSKPFACELNLAEADCGYILYKRNKGIKGEEPLGYSVIPFECNTEELPSIRKYEKTPFVPTDTEQLNKCASESLNLQAEGLSARLKHTGAKCAVLGLSGGLDSTLAILVAVTAMKKLNRSPKEVYAITMPCFGTTSRTFNNSIKLAKALGTTIKKIDIGKAVTRHLKDIKHDGSLDVTFENAQARERTQVLMDVANMKGGLVVGTGDLSEVALGWATYNGDHMSMYGVNCTVPKTLVRHLVEYYAKNCRGKLKAVLNDILDTPVSPELLPAENDAITQKTEDIVGPYILHDFFLYNYIVRGFSPEKIYYIAKQTFNNDFKPQTILKWLKIFFRRFFNQQFKRSCVPDGVKVGEVSLSPRGSYKMPSDAWSTLWLKELENLE